MLIFRNRFARQNYFKPPSEFPLTSSYTSIAHHLSGPSDCSHAKLVRRQTLEIFRDSILLIRTNVRLLGPCFKTGRIKALPPMG
eukprot:maker-scaffold_142-snap-gene-0.16-mRNA-1 protein AED:0.47 eAED:0.57 QI:0/0/0/1/0/0/2/0/83